MKSGCSQTDVCASSKDTNDLHPIRDAGSAPPPLHEEAVTFDAPGQRSVDSLLQSI